MTKTNTQTISSTSNQVLEVSTIHPMLAIASQQAGTPAPATDGSKAEEIIKLHGSVSAAIRALLAQNYSRGDVAKMLNKRYQHVRNVEITPIKKQK